MHSYFELLDIISAMFSLISPVFPTSKSGYEAIRCGYLRQIPSVWYTRVDEPVIMYIIRILYMPYLHIILWKEMLHS